MIDGQCYQMAYKLHQVLPGSYLCHGTVSGQGPLIGKRIDHAWVELNDSVIDNDKHYLKEPYYAIGGIETVYRYSQNEVLKMQPKDYGPWATELKELEI